MDTSRRVIVTDYFMAVEDLIHQTLQGDPIGATLVLPYWGGTLDGETHSISHVRLPQVGERLLVMLRPDWARTIGTAVVGFNSGLFVIGSGTDRSAQRVLDSTGQSLALVGDRLVRSKTDLAQSSGVSVSTFVDWLRNNIADIKSRPIEAPRTVDRNDPRVIRTFAKAPVAPTDPEKGLTLPIVTTQTAAPMVEAIPANLPDASFAPVDAWQGAASSHIQAIRPYFREDIKPVLPAVFNPLPPTFVSVFPQDQYQMSKWNYYLADAFRVVAPTGTWAWRDGVSDITGWPTSAQLFAQHKTTWEALGGTLGVTFTRCNGPNETCPVGSTAIESDIALNPGVVWTLDDEWVIEGGNVKSFRYTMLHELGHALGLGHDFNKLGVMNYLTPSRYSFFAIPYLDDAAGARALHPPQAVSRTDLGVYLYQTYQTCSDGTKFYDCVRAATIGAYYVYAGGNITFSDYRLENVGTTFITSPTVEWYLTTQRNFAPPYYSLGAKTYPSLAPGESLETGSAQTTLPVGPTVPPGYYYLAGLIRNDGGASQGTFPFSNNYTFSESPILVNPLNLGYFRKLTPAFDATDVALNPVLTWEASANALSYEYCIDAVPGFACEATWNSVGANLSVALSDLNPLTTYYWQVRAVNGVSIAYADGSPFSVFQFPTRDGPPGLFDLLSPEPGEAVSTSPTLSWSVSVGAVQYEYCIDKINDGDCTETWVSTGLNASVALSNLDSFTTYCWWVRATNALGSRYLPGVPCFNTTSAPTMSPQGGKLFGADASGASSQGLAVDVSADGRTVIVGGGADAGGFGAAWIWSRQGATWTQEGSKLIGVNDPAAPDSSGKGGQGTSVSLSADGNTALVGGPDDNNGVGAAWVWIRSNGSWLQQGPKLVGAGAIGASRQGESVSISADGNTAVIGGPNDDDFTGAVWVWTRTAGAWTQQGPKLIGSGVVLPPYKVSQGSAVAVSGDGNTLIFGAPTDFNPSTLSFGSTWVWTRSGGVWSQQGPKLEGSGTTRWGTSVALSGDGNTAIAGDPGIYTVPSSTLGSASILTRTAGTWTVGPTLSATDLVGNDAQGTSVSLSSDGKHALVGGGAGRGAAWAWARRGNAWIQEGLKIVGPGSIGLARQGTSVAFDSTGDTAVVGGPDDSAGAGAAWIFVAPPALVDLGADGQGDALLYDPSNGGWSRQLSQSGGGFSEQSSGQWAPGLSVIPASFDADALTDFFTFNAVTGEWAKMINTGTGFATQASGAWWPGWERYLFDLDGDGLSDLFLYDPATGIWFKCVSTSTGFAYTQGGWNPGWEVHPMTMNADHLGDLFLINRTTGRWFWVLGQPGPGFSYPVTETWFPGWQIHRGDFDGDGLTDVLLHDPPTGTYFVATTGAGGFSYAQGAWSLGWTPYAADLNGDGKHDLLLLDSATGVWFQMIGDGTGFTNAGGQTWSLGWQVQATDFNGDGRADFLLYHLASGVWYQAFNLAPGSFTYVSGTWNPSLIVTVRQPIR